jgi:hypothetical protein
MLNADDDDDIYVNIYSTLYTPFPFGSHFIICKERMTIYLKKLENGLVQ